MRLQPCTYSLTAVTYQTLLRMSLDGSSVLASTLLAPGAQSFVAAGASGTAWVDGPLGLPLLPLAPLASLHIQLDDRAVFLERWRALLGEVIERAGVAGRSDHAVAAGKCRDGPFAPESARGTCDEPCS